MMIMGKQEIRTKFVLENLEGRQHVRDLNIERIPNGGQREGNPLEPFSWLASSVTGRHS
jgi:hypothetical protein